MLSRLHLTASISLIALILLNLLWEWRLAPLQPGGSWLVVKALLLLLPLPGILKGKRYTYQWASMFILLFLMEGLVRAFSESGLSLRLARLETLLSLVFFISTIAYARLSAPSRMAQAQRSPEVPDTSSKHSHDREA